jgi:diadenylate cyclase
MLFPGSHPLGYKPGNNRIFLLTLFFQLAVLHFKMIDVFQSLRPQDIIDILIVAYILYRVFLIIRGTRTVQMLTGIAVLIIMYFGARELELMTLYWLLGTVLSSIILIIIILFQADIRKALTQVGQTTSFSKTAEQTIQTLEEIVLAVDTLSRKKIGALIVIENETGIKDFIESGHPVDARLSKELLISLFLTSSPLHDGGVMISEGRIMTASCVLPLSKNPYISTHMGTRHRAAIGISEETDAVIIVVSEENQEISLVQHGAIASNLEISVLRKRLETIFIPPETDNPQLWKSWLTRK